MLQQKKNLKCIRLDFTEKFVKLNSTTWFAVYLTGKFVKVFIVTWFDGKFRGTEYCNFIYIWFDGKIRWIEHYTTSFDFYQTEKFVKVNTST